MTVGTRQLGLMLAGLVLLTGCASSKASTQSRPNAKSPGVAAMTPGMVMPDGSTMGAMASDSSRTAPESKPSASALMICAADVRSDIGTALAIKGMPAGAHTFANGLYTCTYKLPMGTLVLSVKQSPDTTATTNYYTTLRTQLGNTASLDGLGEAAYGTTDGTVVLRKDNDVLRVDATRMPSVFGSQHAKRNDFAYEVAAVILGCWTGD